MLKASCNSATSISLGFLLDMSYALGADWIVDFNDVRSSIFVKLAEIDFCPMPDIQTGVSVNCLIFSSDASNTAAAPLHGIEQSSNRRLSVRQKALA